METVRPAGKDAVIVVLPNGEPITATHIGILKCRKLPLQARKYHQFPDMNNKTLVSLGKLYDCDMMTTSKIEMLIFNNLEPDKIIMKEKCSVINGRCCLNLQDSTSIVKHIKY